MQSDRRAALQGRKRIIFAGLTIFLVFVLWLVANGNARIAAHLVEPVLTLATR